MNLPWKGHYLRVERDRSTTWLRCANCGRRLSDPESMARGVGPDCLRDHEAEYLAERLAEARENDRKCWRYDVAVEEFRSGRRDLRPAFDGKGRRSGVARVERDRLVRAERAAKVFEAPPGATSDHQERWRRWMDARRGLRGAS